MAKKPAIQAPKIENRRARFDYFIDEEIEAGIALVGTEVKSLRLGKANIQDAYASEKGEEIWLINAYIAEFEGGNRFNHESRRPRKLLLKRREIKKLLGLVRTKGVTLVPLKMYFTSKGYAKVLLGLARGKKQHDKRESEKERSWQRQKASIMKHNV